MTRLRKVMLEELQRRNYSQTTVKNYLSTVEDFAKHFRRSPDQLGPEQIRSYGMPCLAPVGVFETAKALTPTRQSQFKTHSCRVRRKRERLPSNGLIQRVLPGF